MNNDCTDHRLKWQYLETLRYIEHIINIFNLFFYFYKYGYWLIWNYVGSLFHIVSDSTAIG